MPGLRAARCCALQLRIASKPLLNLLLIMVLFFFVYSVMGLTLFCGGCPTVARVDVTRRGHNRSTSNGQRANSRRGTFMQLHASGRTLR